MNTKDYQQQTTSLCRIARWVALCTAIVFILASFFGIAPANHILSGVGIGALFFVTLFLSLRTQFAWLRIVAFLIMMLGHKVALHILPSETYPQFFQWLCLAWFTATIPLSIFPALVFRLCRLQPLP